MTVEWIVHERYASSAVAYGKNMELAHLNCSVYS